MRTLVMQTSFIGDMVLTTPLLSHLAKTDEVDVVGTPASVGLLANHPAVRRAIPYDKRGMQRGIAGFSKLAVALRREGYDRALLAQGSARSGALAVAAGIGRRVGFDTSAGRAFYTDRVVYVENEHHALRLLRLSGSNASSPPRPNLFPGPAERQAVNALVREGTQHLIALAPGSVWATKRWPGYALLASVLAHWRFVVIGSAADTDLARAISAAAPGRVVDATGKLSLLASAELIRRCRVLVTNDSAPQHLASAMNTPTVTVFGPTVPAFGFGPLAERAATVGIDALACRPCDRHGPVACPLGHWKCMRDVGVDTLIRAIEQVADAAAF
jgi:heptosyltransferase II